MKISLCQMDIIWESKEENQKKAEEFMRKASELGADMILFPEMSFTGFSMRIDHTGEQRQETKLKMMELAGRYRISTGFGWTALENGMGENHYTLLSDTGAELSDYVKLHPFSYAGEDRVFRAGEELALAEYRGRRLGTVICYDLRFPEVFQALSRKADIILVPANWPERRAEHWKLLLRARALENQVYILGINCAGEKDGIFYSGDSCVVNPAGELTAGYIQGEQLLTVEIADDVERYRAEFPVKQDRRTEFYKKIL